MTHKDRLYHLEEELQHRARQYVQGVLLELPYQQLRQRLVSLPPPSERTHLVLWLYFERLCVCVCVWTYIYCTDIHTRETYDGGAEVLLRADVVLHERGERA